ncbi:hypothetical protein POM88_040775 [Heracleum sosnowskyi]|uniref:Uncharacterized protein n=1 Tax=Heracleum sosnowskyi TaxID=360622 RepID=A0AAD8HDK4_9APIA|nr:hypothetical protein POM88_040775 [Heracleum sosnowskyi]
MCWTPSIIVNGCPYWNCSSANLILKFEVQSNVFRNLILPFAPRLYSLVTISDCLALIKHAYASDGSAYPNMDVYSFNAECSLWSKTYTINFEALHISACLKLGGETVFNGKETLYNHKMKEFISDKGYFYNGFSYSPSLVSLKGMCEVGIDHFLPRP